MFYTGRRIKGAEAVEMGLADALAPLDEVRGQARGLAGEIAISGPLGVIATRATLRAGLADKIARATDHELAVQSQLRESDDFKEGVKAMSERRAPSFKGA